MSYFIFAIAVVIGMMSYLVLHLPAITNRTKEMSNIILKEEDDADFHYRRALLAFHRAKLWRADKVAEIYSNVSADELGNATRWISYAKPFAEFRSCLTNSKEWSNSGDLVTIQGKLQLVSAPEFAWNESCRKGMLALHSFHTTGIEGNVLSLAETLFVINNKSLIIGFENRREESFLTPMTLKSVKEVRNVAGILDTLHFSSPQTSPNMFLSMNKSLLFDINSAILGSTNTTTSFRIYPVAVGHQHIVLPMPEEVSHLVDLYIDWINRELNSLRSKLQELNPKDILMNALSLACDAHTKFVHIHPFSDGNGRLARILSGLVLQTVLLPAPLFLKEEQFEYIKAVRSNTIYGDPTVLCRMHLKAVHQSIDAMVNVSKNGCHLEYSNT